VVEEQPGGGTLTGGQRPLVYLRRSQSWGAAPSTPARNAIDQKLTNVGRSTVTGDRARLTGDQPLRVRIESDGDGSLRLDVALPAGSTVERIEGPPVPGTTAAGARARAAAAAPEAQLDGAGASFRVAQGARTYLISRPQAAGTGAEGGGGGGGGGGSGQGDDKAADPPTRDFRGTSSDDPAGDGGSLPFTGLAVALMALLGLTLALTGGDLRRRLAR
jgi:hypothetical protein